ncbi:uncharacterized protein LOC108899588 isoform X2 [Lates calcarifer]|uniref:Uncharacterized protein LOC108899588 isoform X2 n=1 Tax=Lates calcarifer TaxID=8187 RepID=A0AAJ8DUT7_LATCA|nr:uncharacterized protein LOC108899588 isoform X2 [Lates calcarifer]
MAEGRCTEFFVDKHQEELIQRVTNITPVIEALVSRKVINKKSYDEIMSIPDTEGRMRALYSGPLKVGGGQGKRIFYNILETHEPYLLDYLKKTKCENTLDKVQVETMTMKTLLLETLNELSFGEFDEFKARVKLEKGFPLISKSRMTKANRKDAVELMVETFSHECVEVTMDVFMDMNRTDLLQRLSDVSLGTEAKHSADEQWTTLIQREETMASVIELLLETLIDLSDRELQFLKKVLLNHDPHQRHFSDIPWGLLMMADLQNTVALVVQIYGQQSVEEMKKVLKRMNRTDLVERLCDSSSGAKKKNSVDKHLFPLIHKVATMIAVKELLLETLTGLSRSELKKFKWLLQLTCFQKELPYISWRQLQRADSAGIVNLMVEMCSQQSVEVTREIFMDMNRTDLVQRLSETSSGLKEKLSVDECCSAWIQKEETMTSVIELLLETLADLSDKEIKDFKQILLSQIPFHRSYSDSQWRLLVVADLQDTVLLMVQNYGQQSVEETKTVLRKMKRTDLVQRLSDSSSGATKKPSVDERCSALIQKVAKIAAVKQLLLETLNDLSHEELEKFKKVLQLVVVEWCLPDISWMSCHTADRVEIADLMVETYGHQSVEVTKKVFMNINRTDLVQRLSETSSTPKEKHSGDEHRPAQSERVKQILLETLNDLSHKELEKFRRLLQFTYFQKNLPQIPWSQLNMADGGQIVDLMVKRCGHQSVEVTMEVFMDMNRTDLVQRLSESLRGSSGSLELAECGSSMESSDWTKLEPEVNSTDADETPTYSLQSEAGNFECSVSALRWVCKEKVSLKYQFWSWEGHMERMASRRYMPAGPLMDISVISGKLDEVYLPHWICVEDNPSILDRFAVLHIDDCGDVVEKVSEVTPSHVKLSEPVFSPRAVLMKAGLPVKINCNVLIYKTNTAFLTLHVYLIPCDPGLQQAMDKRELSFGYKIIRKPHPEKSLKMQERFILTADLDSAEIYPEKLKLRYESRNPNFFEMFIENPHTNFKLSLTKEDEPQPVWTCVIRKDEYQSTGQKQGKHFVDEHQCDLIDRVSNIGPILDNLLKDGVIQQEDYDQIRAIPTTQEKMRKLYGGPLKAGGHESKDIFYRTLEEKEPCLISDLNRNES